MSMTTSVNVRGTRARAHHGPTALPLIIATLAIIAGTAAAQDRDPNPPASPAAAAAEVLNFSLIDYHGRAFELRRTDARAVVLFFTGVGCPIARQNAPKLQALAERFAGQGVIVRMVNATPQNDPGDAALDLAFELGRVAPRAMLGDRYPFKSMREVLSPEALGDRDTLREETRESLWGPYPLPPVLRDEHQLVSHYFGVTRTGDTIVIDTRTSTVLYRGAVDDQFVEGARKPKPTQNYLADALAEFLAGKPVTTPRTKAHGCAITYESEFAGDQPVSYARQVAPILQRKCVGCHSPGNLGPFAMSDYKKVRGWSAMMREVILDRRMPPWHADPHYGKFANDRSLTGPEARTLLRWIEQGSPRGDGDDPLPSASLATAPSRDWALGQPDFVVPLPRQEIPATGTVDYRYIDANFEMPRDAWLRAAVTRPGNARVVHHVIVRVRYPAGHANAAPEAYLFTTWVPGLEEREFPAGTGVFVPKGARFNFEIHYTTTGEPQADETRVGLYLAKEPPKARLEVRATETRALDIPPGEPNAQHTTTYCFKRDAMLYELSPHMHVRGSWFRFQLLLPDGRRETLLSVPNYDFNWQTGYRLAEPRRIPAGAWLLCTGGFDNSARNPHNPDPAKRVRWGPQSWNEMFMGFATVAEVPSQSPAGPAK
jgi:hypothetical protein